MHRRHRAIESKKFVAKIDAEVPADLDLYLVCGNESTHKTPAVPTSSSWLNQVERWFGPLTDKKLRRGVHKSATVLENDIQSWIKNWNGHPRPFTWTRPPTRSSNGSLIYSTDSRRRTLVRSRWCCGVADRETLQAHDGILPQIAHCGLRATSRAWGSLDGFPACPGILSVEAARKQRATDSSVCLAEQSTLASRLAEYWMNVPGTEDPTSHRRGHWFEPSLAHSRTA
jgi:hypothetical protein